MLCFGKEKTGYCIYQCSIPNQSKGYFTNLINDELSMYTNYVRSKSTGSQNNISIALSYKTKPSDKCTETGANLDNLTDLETFEHQSHSCEITNSCRLAAELMEGNPLPADTQNGHLNHTLP